MDKGAVYCLTHKVYYCIIIKKYALKISDVYEIIKMQNITPIPNSKNHSCSQPKKNPHCCGEE